MNCLCSVLITVVDREELQQPAFHTMGNLEYPELHEESVGNLASIRAIVKLMAVTGVSDFSMMDIFKPESKRTINNLSAIINFSKYKYVPCFWPSSDTQFVSDNLYSGRWSMFSLMDQHVLCDKFAGFWEKQSCVDVENMTSFLELHLMSPLCKSVECNDSWGIILKQVICLTRMCVEIILWGLLLWYIYLEGQICFLLSMCRQEKENQLAELLDEREQAFLQFQHSEERLAAVQYYWIYLIYDCII